MSFKSILGTIVCIGIAVFILSLFNNSNSEEKHIEDLLAKAEEFHKNRNMGVDEAVFKNILEELDKAFVPVATSLKIFRKLAEILKNYTLVTFNGTLRFIEFEKTGRTG